MSIMGRPPGLEPIKSKAFKWAVFLTLFLSLLFGFLAPFCCSFVFDGEVQEVQPWLIGFQGIMPIKQLESMVIDNHAGRLEYAASSGLLCSRDSSTRKGIAPVIDMITIPAGSHIFTLLDTRLLPLNLGIIC
jgi:hypothetical protein